MTISFINPIGDCQVPINPYTLSIDLGRAANVALVINKIVDCDKFMDQVGQALQYARPKLTITAYETGNITFADSSLIKQIAYESDAAICAIGHCGSCTAGTVKDGIALVEKGIPSVSLITELFWDQSNILSRSLGWPGLPRVMLPYPVWGTSQRDMKATAEFAVTSLLPLLEVWSENAA